jgi:hypothetical protein
VHLDARAVEVALVKRRAEIVALEVGEHVLDDERAADRHQLRIGVTVRDLREQRIRDCEVGS